MYVIFDMDGVIADSESVYEAACMHVARMYNLPESDMREAFARATGVTDERERQILEETFGHLPQFSIEKTYRASREYFVRVVEAGQLKLRPGAAEILRCLKERGAKVGLASSSPRPMIEKVLGTHGVLQYFDVVVSGDMVENSKPDPEIFLKCAVQLGIPESKYSEVYVMNRIE